MLAVNPESEKAHWRAARALFATGKLVDAATCCDRGLKVSPENRDFSALKSKIEKKQEEEEEERRARELKLAVRRALEARGVVIDNRPSPAEVPDPYFLGTLSEENIPLRGPQASTWKAPEPTRTLVFFVGLLYVEHQAMGLVPLCREDQPMEAFLKKSIPGPGSGAPHLSWDTDGRYHIGNVNLYAQTNQKRILKVGKKMTLRRIIDQCAAQTNESMERDGFVLKDGLLLFAVFEKGCAAETECIDRLKADSSRTFLDVWPA